MDVLIIVAVVYMLPTVNALLRRHANTAAIATLNVLLGWTVIGWIVALTWSMTSHVKPKVPGTPKAKPQRKQETKNTILDYSPGQDW